PSPQTRAQHLPYPTPFRSAAPAAGRAPTGISVTIWFVFGSIAPTEFGATAASPGVASLRTRASTAPLIAAASRSAPSALKRRGRSEEHTSELQSPDRLVLH